MTCLGRGVGHAFDVRSQAEWDAVHRLIASAMNDCAIARATDGGTNALSMRPAGAMRTCFGEPHSARLHAALAAEAGLAHAIVDLPGLAFDLDRPEDLARLHAA